MNIKQEAVLFGAAIAILDPRSIPVSINLLPISEIVSLTSLKFIDWPVSGETSQTASENLNY